MFIINSEKRHEALLDIFAEKALNEIIEVMGDDDSVMFHAKENPPFNVFSLENSLGFYRVDNLEDAEGNGYNHGSFFCEFMRTDKGWVLTSAHYLISDDVEPHNAYGFNYSMDELIELFIKVTQDDKCVTMVFGDGQKHHFFECPELVETLLDQAAKMPDAVVDIKH